MLDVIERAEEWEYLLAVRLDAGGHPILEARKSLVPQVRQALTNPLLRPLLAAYLKKMATDTAALK